MQTLAYVHQTAVALLKVMGTSQRKGYCVHACIYLCECMCVCVLGMGVITSLIEHEVGNVHVSVTLFGHSITSHTSDWNSGVV